MAIDFLIFGLLLISFTINLLALGAFWVTPGLRTTANRFTINLLIINLIGCLILAPTLFLTGGGTYQSTSSSSSSPFSTTISDDSIEFYSKPGNHQMTIRHNGQLVEKEGVILRRNVTDSDDSGAATTSTDPRTIETIFKFNETFFQELTINESKDGIVITEIEGEEPLPAEQPTVVPAPLPPPPVTMRCWSIDLTAALGALSVLLVVGDTWCAVTDPLRYHSRISGVKTWVLIALTWVLGIFFGALSALRELDFESESIYSKQKRYIIGGVQHPATAASPWITTSWSSSSSLFSMIYACIYFIVIILLPFGFVCGMYWRIFSEARENGLRMRQNGSSPLLQSALNLHAQHQQQQQSGNSANQTQQYSNSLSVHRSSLSSASSQGGGLQLCIDRQQKSSPVASHHRRDSAAKVLLPTISDDSVASDDAGMGIDDADSTHGQLLTVAEHPGNERNVLLTLQAASGEIKRNYSARQLPLLGTSSQDFRETERLQGVRQVHSSPNLQKYTQLRQDSLSDDSSCSPQLLGSHLSHMRPSSHPAQRNHALHHHHHHHHVHLQHSHVLQIPAIHASPKALSYMSSLRHRLSNASSLFKYREESRAARISILVVIMFLVSYLPFGFLVLLQSRLSAANFTHSTQLAIFMLLLGNLSSPFIFAYRNKRVRRGVKRLFGLDARSRDSSQLQRHNSSSGRGSGFLQRHCGGGGHKSSAANIKRTGSKVSTYSTNSCKYLTPQSSVVSNGGGNVKPAALRPNLSCSTIINFSTQHSSNNNNNCSSNNNNNSVEVQQFNSKNIESVDNTASYVIAAATTIDDKSTVLGITARSARPLLQRGITIVEHIPLPLSSQKLATDRRNIFKMFCHSSKSLSCAAQSCAQGSADIEPAEV